MKAAFYFGILFAMVLFLWYSLEYAIGLHGPYVRYHEYVSYFFAIPVVMIMAAAIRYRKARNLKEQPARFWPLFSFGAQVSLVAALAVAPLMYAFATWVNPGFLEALSSHAVQAGKMETAMAARRFALDSFLVLHAALIVTVGSVAAFVIAIIMTGKPERPDVQNSLMA